MNIANRLVTTTTTAILLIVSIVCAQEQNPAGAGRSTIIVTAAATAGRVRFTAPSSVVQMRIEVYASNGEKLFDNEIRGGNVIDWHLQDGRAERLSDGSYLCVITSKSLSGRMSQKLGKITIQNAAATVHPVDATQFTLQQTQAVGPMEENASLTVLKEGETQTATVIAHNGDDGQITRGKGALSFRIGDFFSGKDTEQMRLTAEGNVGIGIAHPLARLDVDGVIRATQGFVFPDGSVQFSAARRTFGAESQKPGQFGNVSSSGKGHFEQQESGTGTENRLAKWLDNAGTLGDSAIVDVNGAIGIGTTTPQSGLDYRNSGAPFFTRDLPTNPGVAQSALQLGLSNLGSRNAGVGPSFLFFGENTAGAKSFLGRVSGVWENPSAGAEAGAIFFQVRANSSDVNALTERMRINSIGNVGIGTTAPPHRLSVFGGPSWTSDFWGGAIAVQNASAIGWQANVVGFGSGIGHTNTGFAIFRTASGLGTTSSGPIYDFRIDNFGNIGVGSIGLATVLTSKMEIFAQDGLRINGFQPFLTLHDTNGGNKSSFMQGVNGDAVLLTNSRAALIVKDVTGSVGIGTTAPNAQLQIAGTGTNGFTLGVEGNVTQNRDKSGFVKAMVYVLENGNIDRCYNGLTGVSLAGGSTNTGCGFTLTIHNTDTGPYTNIDFGSGFQVNDRFWSVTPNLTSGNVGVNSFVLAGPTILTVLAFYTDDRFNFTYAPYMVIIY